MKRQVSAILAALCLATMLSVPAAAAAYTDTEGHWAESSIARWSDYHIVGGNNGSFAPDGSLTCAHLAAIISRLLNLPPAESANFLDVNEDDWFADALNRCAAAGIILGNNGYAMPNGTITRERAMVILARALGLAEGDVSALDFFADVDEVTPYARGYLAALVEAGILGGNNGKLDPKSSITRAQMVVIIDRMVDYYANEKGQTVDAKNGGTVLIAAENVTVKNAPAGTKVIVAEGVTGLSVNGKKVSAGQTYTVPKQTTSGGGSSGSSNVHTHTYAPDWSMDETNHWHAATCGHSEVRGDQAAHTYGTVTTDWENLKNTESCTACGYTRDAENQATYFLTSVEDLLALDARVDENKQFGGKTVKLTADLDLSGSTFNGVGRNTYDSFPSYAFNGTFDGDGHTISNMSVTSVSAEAINDSPATAGFFPQLGNNAVVQNLKFDHATVVSDHEAGVVAGYCAAASGTGVETPMSAQILNCQVTNSSVTSAAHTMANGSSWNDGDKVGGIVGFTYCDVKNCTVSDTTIKGYRDVGGIVGYANGSAVVEGNTVRGVTIIVDATHDYKAYRAFSEYDVNEIVGEKTAGTTVSNNTATNVAIQIADGVLLNAAGEYELSNVNGLLWFANEVNGGGVTFSGKTVKLMNDVTFTEDQVWKPVGQTAGGLGARGEFRGTFDGDGDGDGTNNKIINMKVEDNRGIAVADNDAPNCNAGMGFFGWLNGTVKNLDFVNANVTGCHYTGVVAGYLETGSIINCNVSDSTVTAPHKASNLCGDKAGGVVGFLGNSSEKIENCVVTNTTVTAARDAGQVIGCAESGTQVINCSAVNVTVQRCDDESCTGANIRTEIVGRDNGATITTNP